MTARFVSALLLLSSVLLAAPPASAQVAPAPIPIPTTDIYPRTTTRVTLQNGVSAYPIKTTRTQSGKPAVADRLLVRFQAGVSDADQATIHKQAASLGAGAARSVTRISANGYLVDVSGAASLEAAAQAYKTADGRVVSAAADGLANAPAAPPDGTVGTPWHLAKIHAPDAWTFTHGAAWATIAMLDTGIDPNHPDVAPRVVGRVNVLNGSQTSDDVLAFGTLAAGVAGAIVDNGFGVDGVSYSSQLLNVKIYDDASGTAPLDALTRGIYWAVDHGASVINMNFAMRRDCDAGIIDDIFNTDIAELNDALDYAWTRNVFLVAAGGSVNEQLPSPMVPAVCSHVMGVNSLDQNDQLFASNSPGGSNFGGGTTIGAPGVNILSTAPPSGAICPARLPGGLATCTGTGMASAMVSGLAALAHASCGSMTNQQLFDRIVQSGDPLRGIPVVHISSGKRINALRSICLQAPTHLHASGITPTSITLAWDDNTAAEDHFEMQSKLTSDNTINSWTSVTLAANTTSWQHDGLTPGVSYDHRIRACNVGSSICTDFSGVFTMVAGFKTLSVTVGGAGKVTSLPAGINCGQGFTACSMQYAPGTVVSLSATALNNPYKHIANELSAWGGDCSGDVPTCVVMMDSPRSASATFVRVAPDTL